MSGGPWEGRLRTHSFAWRLVGAASNPPWGRGGGRCTGTARRSAHRAEPARRGHHSRPSSPCGTWGSSFVYTYPPGYPGEGDVGSCAETEQVGPTRVDTLREPWNKSGSSAVTRRASPVSRPSPMPRRSTSSAHRPGDGRGTPAVCALVGRVVHDRSVSRCSTR